MDTSSPDITQLIQQWQKGEPRAADALFTKVYHELRKMAGQYMARERADHTLTPTGLVNQAFLNLDGDKQVNAQNRAHFYAIVATKMRHYLVDYARKHKAEKRGEGIAAEAFDDELHWLSSERAGEILALDEALEHLAQVEPFQAKIVELRYFGGYQQDEIAEMLGVHIKKVRREWYLARAWLKEVLSNTRGQ